MGQAREIARPPADVLSLLPWLNSLASSKARYKNPGRSDSCASTPSAVVPPPEWPVCALQEFAFDPGFAPAASSDLQCLFHPVAVSRGVVASEVFQLPPVFPRQDYRYSAFPLSSS